MTLTIAAAVTVPAYMVRLADLTLGMHLLGTPPALGSGCDNVLATLRNSCKHGPAGRGSPACEEWSVMNWIAIWFMVYATAQVGIVVYIMIWGKR